MSKLVSQKKSALVTLRKNNFFLHLKATVTKYDQDKTHQLNMSDC